MMTTSDSGGSLILDAAWMAFMVDVSNTPANAKEPENCGEYKKLTKGWSEEEVCGLVDRLENQFLGASFAPYLRAFYKWALAQAGVAASEDRTAGMEDKGAAPPEGTVTLSGDTAAAPPLPGPRGGSGAALSGEIQTTAGQTGAQTINPQNLETFDPYRSGTLKAGRYHNNIPPNLVTTGTASLPAEGKIRIGAAQTSLSGADPSLTNAMCAE